MENFDINGPIQPGSPVPEQFTKIKAPSSKDLKKTEEVASKELGVVSKNSRIQGSVKNLFQTEKSTKLGKEVREFAESVVQKFADLKTSLKTISLKSRKDTREKNEKKLQGILQEFKDVNKAISNFEERGGPLNLEDEDSIMKHLHEEAVFRERLQQIRDKAEGFDPEIKKDILVVVNTLMERLSELVTEKFDAKEFFKIPPQRKQQPDEELARYFGYEETQPQGNVEDLLRELEKVPEGEMPDEIPAASKKDPFEELKKDLEELRDPWNDWDYSEDSNDKKS